MADNIRVSGRFRLWRDRLRKTEPEIESVFRFAREAAKKEIRDRLSGSRGETRGIEKSVQVVRCWIYHLSQ